MAILNDLKERWQEVRKAVLARHGDVIDEQELDEVAGQREKLCHLLGEKCGLTQAQANRELDQIMTSIQFGQNV